MVSVALSLEGVIAELVAEGHAGMALKGSDIVCSAFTILLRTFARTVEACSGVGFTVREDGSGRFHLVVTDVGSVVAEQYRGWCEFLLRGFEDLKGDAPLSVRIEYGRHSGRLFHGS
jgi:uncharacterized protein YsxB (DUF464 family)